MSLKYAIALTGGIASGKSTTASLLRLYGYFVICADSIAHKVLETCKNKVLEAFGSGILSENGGISRARLGEIVFKDSSKKAILEAILHPKIKEEILKKATKEEAKKTPYFIDIPLFFEANNYPISKSLLIYATKELQLKRLMERNNLSKEAALARVESQMPLDEKLKLADFVIKNCGSLEELQKEVESYLKTL